MKNLTLTQVVFAIASIFFAGFFAAYVFSSLWLWFFVPLGVPAIGTAHAYGILVVKELVFYRTRNPVPAPEGFNELMCYVAMDFCVPAVVLVIGYIINSFFMVV